MRIIGMIAAASLFAGVAMADCEEQCNNGFNVCMRNCGGQAGCLETCSRGRSGCLRRCGSSQNFVPILPWTFARVNRAEPATGPIADRCIGKGETCTLHGTPCCDPYTCQGRFPNTTCQ
jgi:hypothetical protein